MPAGTDFACADLTFHTAGIIRSWMYSLLGAPLAARCAASRRYGACQGMPTGICEAADVCVLTAGDDHNGLTHDCACDVIGAAGDVCRQLNTVLHSSAVIGRFSSTRK